MKEFLSPEAHHLNERLRRSLDNLVDGYVLLSPVKDSEGKITDFIYSYANESAAKTVGISQDDIIGRTVSEIFPAHKTLGLIDKYIEVAYTGIPLVLESFKYNGYYIEQPFRGVFDILASRLDDDVAVSWHNVTAYKEAIDKLTLQHKRLEILSDLTQKLTENGYDYQAVLNTVAERASSIIGDGCIIGLISEDNPEIECAALFHKDPRAKLLLNEVITSYNLNKDEAIVAEAINSGSTVFMPYVDIDEVKKTLPGAYHRYIDAYGVFSLVIVPLKAHGNVIGVIVLLRDMTQEPYTHEDIQLFEEIAVKSALYINNARLYLKEQHEIEERKKAEESLRIMQQKLEESNRELQSFAYVTSHDLKEPLRMISGFLELLAKRYKGKLLDEKADTFIQYAVDGSKRLNKMISDILEYSRVVTKGREFEEIDSGKVLETTIKYLSRIIEESNAVITYDDLPVLKADPTQLERIFQNLIANAIKFNTSPEPQIHISARQSEDEWIFMVNDNGIGIEKDQYENIFMLFKRLYPETYPGTGSGLPITKRIIDRHGGRIWVESEEGKGSTFYFTIPVKE